MIDERGFVLVEKAKDEERFVKVLREKEKAERDTTFLFVADTLVNTCSVLKAQISKALKKCLRRD